MRAKLPKLTIAKFDGSYKDWPRFWTQYTETIDESSIASVSKFADLKELLCLKARNTIDALSFTPERYNRAKSILISRLPRVGKLLRLP